MAEKAADAKEEVDVLLGPEPKRIGERVTCAAFLLNISLFVAAFVVPVVVSDNWANNYSYYPLFCFLWAVTLLGYLVPSDWDYFFYTVDARVIDQRRPERKDSNPRDRFFGRAIMVASSASVWFLAMSAGRELTGVDQTARTDFALWGCALGVGLLTAISLEFRVMLVSIPLTVLVIGVFVRLGGALDSAKWIGAIVAMSVGGFLLFGCLVYHCLKTVWKDTLYKIADVYYLLMMYVAVSITPVVLFFRGDRFDEFCKLKIEDYYQLALAILAAAVFRMVYGRWLRRLFRAAATRTWWNACKASCFCLVDEADAPVASVP